MLSKFLELLMVFTSLSPVLLTLWFKEFSQNWDYNDGLVYLIVAVVLWTIAFVILRTGRKKLQLLPVKIESISTADKEMISFIFAYLIPLLEISYPLLFFLLGLFVFIVLTTHSYHFNPVFGLFGYHYYEVSIEGGTTFILMTKKTLMNTKQINSVVQLTDYILLEKEV
ncbi:hypothetical protein [Rosettibacter firmus]|uniref:hypothetical protein n=1 Tax=Rosettibacter firmus TaxID=3111522 RepID=UPI00336C2355